MEWPTDALYAACTEKRNAKSYNTESRYAHHSFDPGGTKGNARSDYPSAAKSPGCGSALPTIMCFQENIRCNNIIFVNMLCNVN